MYYIYFNTHTWKKGGNKRPRTRKRIKPAAMCLGGEVQNINCEAEVHSKIFYALQSVWLGIIIHPVHSL